VKSVMSAPISEQNAGLAHELGISDAIGAFLAGRRGADNPRAG
jgi:hypothetical protein